jgi:hypothetical protein
VKKSYSPTYEKATVKLRRKSSPKRTLGMESENGGTAFEAKENFDRGSNHREIKACDSCGKQKKSADPPQSRK